MSLVHINIAHIRKANVNRLHQRARVHVMQKCTIRARAEERRVRESVRARERGEGQRGPGAEVPAVSVAWVDRRREERVCPSLFLVWWRVGGLLGLAVCKVAGQTPDLLLAFEAVEDEISIFILAVGIGTNVKLETRRRGQ